MKILLCVVGGYLVVLSAAWAFQDRLMFFPDTTPMEECRDGAGQPAPLYSEEGVRFYQISPPSAAVGAVLYFHGNGGRACDRIDFLKPFLSWGYKVIVPEYPGYAERSKRPTEAQLLNSALESFDRSQSLQPFQKVILFGESLGTTVATYVASQRQNLIDGLILQAPFTSVKDVGQDRYFFLPVRWISSYTFPADVWARQVEVPVLSYHGTSDAVVPIRFGRKQVQNFASRRKLLWEIEGAGHLNVGAARSEELWQRIGEFVNSL